MFEDILDMLNAFTWQQMIWLAVALFFTFVFYKLTSMLIRRVILRANGTEGDVKMIIGV